jgi:predicted MFS family arabinose efflux permease
VSFAGYRATLATPGIVRLYAASVVARMPLGFGTLAVVLLVRDATGSFSMAGAAAGAELLTAALTAAPLGRLVDRLGQTRVLVPLAVFNAASLSVLALAGLLDAPGGALIALAALVGVMPPVSACHRALLATMLSGDRLQSAYALESIVQEGMYTGGPLLVAAAVAFGGPADALIAGAAFTLLGTLWFANAGLSRQWRAPAVTRSGGGALNSPVVRLLVLYGVLAGSGFGAFEVAVTAFARERGSPNAAGLLLAVWAVGSMSGGLWYGSRDWRRPAARRFGEVSWVVAAAFVPAIVAPSLWSLAPLMAVAGLAIAPMASLLYTLCGELAPEGMMTESFTWLNTAFPIGIGAGAALCGVVVDGPGARAGIALACVGPALAALAATAWRGVLLPEGARSVAGRRGTHGPRGAVRTGPAADAPQDAPGADSDVR